MTAMTSDFEAIKQHVDARMQELLDFLENKFADLSNSTYRTNQKLRENTVFPEFPIGSAPPAHIE